MDINMVILTLWKMLLQVLGAMLGFSAFIAIVFGPMILVDWLKEPDWVHLYWIHGIVVVGVILTIWFNVTAQEVKKWVNR